MNLLKLDKYIEKCFKDAFKSENKEYNKDLYYFEYILIKNSKNIYQLYPIMDCKFYKVLSRIDYRLKNNLFKNFNIFYKNTNDLCCDLFYSNNIDFNFTKAMFHTKLGNISFNVYDEKTNPYENNLSGECMIAYTYEKLLFKYHNLTPDIYKTLSEVDERYYLPDFLNKDWKTFKSLYKDTFNIKIGNNYDIICSKGLKRL